MNKKTLALSLLSVMTLASSLTVDKAIAFNDILFTQCYHQDVPTGQTIFLGITWGVQSCKTKFESQIIEHHNSLNGFDDDKLHDEDECLIIENHYVEDPNV